MKTRYIPLIILSHPFCPAYQSEALPGRKTDP